MVKITYQNGKVVFKDSKIGTEQACCCTQDECLCENRAFDDCPESFSVTYEATGAFLPECDNTFTFTITKDPVLKVWQGGVTNFVSIELFCLNGRWILTLGHDNYPEDCFALAQQSVDIGSACSCPVTGTYQSGDGDFPPNSPIVLA